MVALPVHCSFKIDRGSFDHSGFTIFSKINQPLNAILVCEHTKIRAKRSVGNRHFQSVPPAGPLNRRSASSRLSALIDMLFLLSFSVTCPMADIAAAAE